MKSVKYHTMALDSSMIKMSALEEIKRSYKAFGLYVGNIEVEYYGEARTDTYNLYVAEKKMTKAQLKAEFGFMLEG